MKTRGIIIQGSSRNDGNTSQVTAILHAETGFDLVDLSLLNIGHYDYGFQNADDDFRRLFKKIVKSYDTLVFATPVYWYTMSGLIKVFLDRISDFLTEEKDIGRMLRGKAMAVISCGSDGTPVESFETPFIKSADYLGMQYDGYLHTYLRNGRIPEIEQRRIQEFAEGLLITSKPLN